MAARKLKSAQTSDGLGFIHGAAYCGDPLLLFALKNSKLWAHSLTGAVCVDHYGRTPLHYCVLAKHEEGCRLLQDWGFAFNDTDSDGNTALSYAPTAEFRESLFRLGISTVHGVSVRTTSRLAWSLMMF